MSMSDEPPPRAEVGGESRNVVGEFAVGDLPVFGDDGHPVAV